MFCTRCGKQFGVGRVFCFECGTRLGRSVSLSSFKAARTTKVGAVLDGRFALCGLLGQGATSRVYLADDLVSKQPVAVKLFAGIDAASKERFVKEATALAAVHHPNVLKVHYVGKQEGKTPFFALEILRGESMGDYLRREGKMAPSLTLDLLRQAAAGLAAAHEAGVVHRDIKPDNLYLLGDPGEPFGLKVIDFGFARLGRRKSSAAGVIVGTLAYMAPEQILCEEIDARTDVYALGAVAFRALAGRLPFPSQDDALVAAQHLLQAPPPLRPLVPEIDARTERVVLAAMRKHPDNRYPTMDAMRADLAKLVGLEPGDVMGVVRTTTRDVYEPKTDRGKSAAEAFRHKHANTVQG